MGLRAESVPSRGTEPKADLLRWEKSFRDLARRIDYPAIMCERMSHPPERSNSYMHADNVSAPIRKLDRAKGNTKKASTTRGGPNREKPRPKKSDRRKSSAEPTSADGMAVNSTALKSNDSEGPSRSKPDGGKLCTGPTMLDSIIVGSATPTEESAEPRGASRMGKTARLQLQLRQAQSNTKGPTPTRVRLADGNSATLDSFDWEKAQKLSEGRKVRDNPALLSKALKARRKKKESSARKWEARIKETKKKIDNRQRKRRANLSERRRAGRKR